MMRWPECRRSVWVARRVSVALALLGGAIATPESAASAEPAAEAPSEASVRTSLVWILGDDDLFQPPNAASPPSPAASMGDRPGYDAPAEGLSSRYTGRENRAELRMSAHAPGVVPHLDTAATLALGLDASSLGERDEPLRLEDMGSFVEARLALARAVESVAHPPALALRLFPIDGDLERVGQLEMLGWGGATGPRRESPYGAARSAVRAARLMLELSRLSAFVTLKTASFLEPVSDAPSIEETSYGVFGGVEARPVQLLRLGVSGGYLELGRLPVSAGAARAFTAGASAQLSLQSGTERPNPPIAFASHGDDPFVPRPKAAPVAWAVGLEAAQLLQRLADFDRPGQTALAPARAIAVLASARLGRFELSGAFVLREPEFVVRNVPGVFPGQTVPLAAQRASERALLLTPSVELSTLFRFRLGLGLRYPAAVMTRAIDRLGQPTGATLVVSGPADVELLPAGTVPVPVVDVRPAFEARLSRLLFSVAWIQYRRDYNRTRPAPSASGTAGRGFADPDRVGAGLAVRAVW